MTEQREPGNQHPAANTPRTAAGRELVEDEPSLVTGEHSMLARVLRIEAEAAALTPAEPGYYATNEEINEWRRTHGQSWTDPSGVEHAGNRLDSARLGTGKARVGGGGIDAEQGRSQPQASAPPEVAAPTPAEPLDMTLMRKTMVSLDRILDGPRPRQWPLADQIAAQYNRLAAARPDTPASAEQPGLREALAQEVSAAGLDLERLRKALLGAFGNFGMMGEDPLQWVVRAEDTARIYAATPPSPRQEPLDRRGHRIGRRRHNGPGGANTAPLAASPSAEGER